MGEMTATEDIAVVVDKASATLDAGPTTVGLTNGKLALWVPGVGTYYALYGTGTATLAVDGVGSITGTFAVRQNKSSTVTIPAQTVSVGSLSVAIPTLMPSVEILEGTGIVVQLQDFVKITGDFAVGQDTVTHDIAVLVDKASAQLIAGPTSVGFTNGKLALLIDGTEHFYALYGSGTATLTVDGVGSITGTFAVRQNKSTTATI